MVTTPVRKLPYCHYWLLFVQRAQWGQKDFYTVTCVIIIYQLLWSDKINIHVYAPGKSAAWLQRRFNVLNPFCGWYVMHTTSIRLYGLITDLGSGHLNHKRNPLCHNVFNAIEVLVSKFTTFLALSPLNVNVTYLSNPNNFPQCLRKYYDIALTLESVRKIYSAFSKLSVIEIY